MDKNITTKSITPGPRILIAIARTVITPINALCELIDNSLDGIINSERSGHKIDNPNIKITIPSREDIDNGVGMLVLEDNGPGMDSATAINAVTAGYSGQENPRDNLGLFGMGFNISSGKLGRKTVLKTYRKEDKTGTKITINLPNLVKSGKFDVPEEVINKENPDYSGTTVEIQEWWPEGDPNFNFIIKLAIANKTAIREQIGRIYATKIRDGLKIFINEKLVDPFFHCRWLDNRFVIGKDGVKIPAYFLVDEVIGKELRCINCYELVATDLVDCPNCGKKDSFKEYENRIYGWVGIQRFADPTNYGIDLIRNGRLISQWEKEAFFEWKNPDYPEQDVKDYPIDAGMYFGGRIIGEIHLDFVPVDFLKSNFQQISLAWIKSINYLRGETSLQPVRAAGKNNSVIYKLFQGYRRIEGGPKYLYPGYWGMNKGQQSFKPLGVEDTKEYYEKFKANEPGYGPNDDEKWFEMVEKAQERPQSGVIKCPECQMQNDENAEKCFNCPYIFRKKQCVKCKADILLSADVCEVCGAEQLEVSEKWICDVCKTENSTDLNLCSHCRSEKGTSNTLSLKYLEDYSQISKNLSKDNVSIKLPNGDYSPSFALEIRTLNPDSLQLKRGNERIPIFVEKTAEKITMVIDTQHPAFIKFQDRIEDYAAIEIANAIYTRSQQASSISKEDYPFWSLANIYYIVQSTLWPEQIEFDLDEIKDEVKNFFNDLTNSLAYLMKGMGRQVYESLDHKIKNALAIEIANNTDLGQLNELIDKNLIFNYFTHDMILQLLKDFPNNFFDGKYWQDAYLSIDMGDDDINKRIRRSILAKYLNCLENLSIYLQLRDPSANDAKRAELALLIVKQKITG